MQAVTTSVEGEVTRRVIDYSHRLLESSAFFSQLSDGRLTLDTLRYVFSQYRLWRDQFHTWFGVCIVKSGSCDNDEVAQAIGNLAEHIVAEMREDHAKIYRDFLIDLGIPESEIRRMPKSQATAAYERSFLAEFGTEPDDFVESVIALSGRELFAALRNTHVIKHLAANYGIQASRWLSLHEELEEEHFRSCLRPFVQSRLRDDREFERLMTVITAEIDRHVAYWEALLTEAGDQARFDADE